MGTIWSTPTAQPQTSGFNSLPEGVRRTKERDIITYDDDQSTDRYEMPCGHAIGALVLKSYVDYKFATGKIEIRCPKCTEIWQHKVIEGILKASSLKYEDISIKMISTGIHEDIAPRRTLGFNSLPEGVRRTKEMDIITYDDDQSTDRYEMPCGHAIGALVLQGYVDSEFSKGKIEIRCPKCNEIWQHKVIEGIFKALSLKYEDISIKVTEYYLNKELQHCPGCGIRCERTNRQNPRVVCIYCSGGSFEFCWYCLQKWKSNDAKRCGNQECSGEDPVLKQLRECKEKTMEYSDVTCPSMRACPSCLLLIKWKNGCKTMTCQKCSLVFCFVCLKKAGSDGKLPCGNYDEACTVAPVQEYLFK